MQAFFQDILTWVNDHQTLSLALVFLIAAGESLAVIGTLVPGISAMLLAGALAGLGVLDLSLTLFWAAIGAIAGDGISFWLGKRYHQQLKNLWPLSRYPGLIPRGEAFFLRHGGKSVLLGRFFGPVRAIIPAIAGIMDMNPWRFYSVNVLSAILWAPAVILPGVAFGAALSVAAEVASRLVVMILVLLIGAWLLFLLIRFVYRHLAPRAEALTRRMLDLAHRHPHIGPLIGAVIDPQEPELRGLLILSLLLVLASAAWFTMLALLTREDLYFQVDALIHGELATLRMPWLHHLTAVPVAMVQAPVLLIATTAGGLLLWLQHYRAASLHLLGAVALACLIPWLTGLLTTLPEGDSAFLPDLSLTLATTLTGILIVMASRSLPPVWRWLPWSLAGIVLLFVYSAHSYQYHTRVLDAAGALGLGLTLTALVGIAWRRHHRQVLAGRSLFGLVALLIVVTAAGIPRGYPSLPQASGEHGLTLSRQQWLRDPRAILPRHPGHHPVTLQWATADSDTIAATLSTANWKPAAAPDWAHMLRWFQADVVANQLPVTPHVWNGFFPVLTLSHPGASDNELVVLRLWHSGVELDDGKQLLVGNVSIAGVDARVPWFRYLVTLPQRQQAMTLFREALASPASGLVGRERQGLLLISAASGPGDGEPEPRP